MGRAIRGDHIGCLDVLLAEMFAHVDMTHCGLVRGMKAHGNGALVAIDCCGVGSPKPK